MKYYWDAEEEKMYSEKELMQVFCDLMKEDDMYQTLTFQDFMAEASGKNGSLVEIKKPLKKSEVEAIKDATYALLDGMGKLHDALSIVSEESFNKFLSREYPFLDSFQDAFYAVSDWCDSVFQNAERLSRKDGLLD